MKPETKTASTPHASETQTLAKLINENVRLKVQLKLAHKDLDNANAEAVKLREQLHYMNYPTLNWPQGLSFKQKLNQFSTLMAEIMKDESCDQFLGTALRKLIADSETELSVHSESQLMALKAHWMFPVVAFGLSKREKAAKAAAEATQNGKAA